MCRIFEKGLKLSKFYKGGGVKYLCFNFCLQEAFIADLKNKANLL